MWDDSEKVKERFFNQRNTGVLETASTDSEVGAIACGSALALMITVDPVAEAIIAAKFQTLRCLYAFVRSSELAELIIGKIVNEALRVTNQHLAGFLDFLPPETMHRSVMGYAATASLRGRECVENRKEGAFVCKGFGVDEGVIRGMPVSTGPPRLSASLTTRSLAARSHASKPSKQWLSGSAQRWSTKASLRKRRPVRPAQRPARSRTPHGRSRCEAGDRFRDPENGAARNSSGLSVKARQMTTLHRIRLNGTAVEGMRSHLRADGGDCELVDVYPRSGYVKLSGACIRGLLAAVTINRMQRDDRAHNPLRHSHLPRTHP
ncbi:Fe-S cluster assembly protein NifU 3 (plasmid) [Rhizobium gallicum]|uniref:Nitrogen fixation protein NifU n=1 Tax=Rhizobium gallicum TaxID=56730 RepID=A0A1L5NQY3_9HYPH|nr:iron-sulfur cluster assembly scaffold protein [Rhizobium gallicum]APO70278.1 Fe-S cluster assembly protein NifU 3 [Rhizobium gallicum]